MSKKAFVIGCGSIGTRHAENLDSLGVDLAVFDTDRDRQKELADRLNADTPDSIDHGLFANPDMAFVCTPSNHHIKPAQKAAEAGCDLFVEKPLSNTAEGITDLLRKVEKNDGVSMIGCNYRFHPAFINVKEILEKEAIGNVVSARIESGSYLPDWHPWEDYREMYSAKEGVGGVLLDAIHKVNYSRWFFGDAKTVSSMLGCESSLEIETEDTASLLIKYKNGVQCEQHSDYTQRAPSMSGQIVGEQGTIRWGGKTDTVEWYDAETKEWTTEVNYENWDANNMYVDMLRHFLDCVENQNQTISSLEEGRKDLHLAIAAKESHRKGQHIQL